jgi:hypothetical protein
MTLLRTNSGKIVRLAVCAALAAGALAVPALASTSTLPIYPASTKTALHSTPKVSMCGHQMGLVPYASAVDGKTVAKWYESKIPGAVVIDTGTTDSASIDTEIQVYTPDGSQVAVIHQMTMTSAKLQAASKTIGGDKTDIGLETFSPPLGADYLSLMQRTQRGDAAAKSSLIAKCPNG